MRKTTTTAAVRRTGRDRRDAGALRRIRTAERGRDLARSEAREHKERALAWNGGVRPAAQSCAVATLPIGRGAAAIRRRVSVVAAGRFAAVGRGRFEAGPAVAPEDAEARPTGRAWLPEAGDAVIVDGVRITAVQVADAPEHPFYVLARAD